MGNKLCKLTLLVLMCLLVTGNQVQACTWAAFASGKAAMVARTMDWYCDDNRVVTGHGRNITVKAAHTAGAFEYTSRYASLQIGSFGSSSTPAIVSEAMNEKGLQGSILYLAGSILPAPQPGHMDIDPANFISYAVSSFATVREVVDNLPRLNFVSSGVMLPGPEGGILEHKGTDWPMHFALADATGDKAVIEFIKGEVIVYHGKEYDALSNEPAYDVHLALESMQYVPSGTILPQDRRARARGYLQDMYERGVATPGRALLAMRGLLASVWAGTEEIDRVDNDVYPTVWGVLADQNSLKYYLSDYDSWCVEIYDFSMFDCQKPEVIILKATDCPHAKIELEIRK